MTHLSVNLNKVALLRNQRDCGYPSVLGTAKRVIAAGAHGITVHPRPDERHVRKTDVYELADYLETQPTIEFNIEGYPTHDFLDMVCNVRCHQVTLVPDAPDQKTSDHGWDIRKHKDFLKDIVTRINNAGKRVSLFIDPDPEMAKLAAEIGAGRVELYTGPYFEKTILVSQYKITSDAAIAAGLDVNAGHDLNLDNLAQFIQAIPECAEVSIGHAIISDALDMGWDETIKAYLDAVKTKLKYTVRPVEENDKPWLDQLRRDVYRDLFFAIWGGWDEERHIRHAEACWDSGHIKIIEVNAKPVGMLQVFDSENHVDIAEIQIAPLSQGKGLGTAVITDILNDAQSHGKTVKLSTGIKNVGALKLYQNLGFVETKRTDLKVYLEK